jgi:predicted benzoate:H+ symporter BenE
VGYLLAVLSCYFLSSCASLPIHKAAVIEASTMVIPPTQATAKEAITWNSTLNLAVPLILVSLTGQFLPGMAIMKLSGYDTPIHWGIAKLKLTSTGFILPKKRLNKTPAANTQIMV